MNMFYLTKKDSVIKKNGSSSVHAIKCRATREGLGLFYQSVDGYHKIHSFWYGRRWYRASDSCGKKVGSGTFTDVYQSLKDDVVEVVSFCPIKEGLLLGWMSMPSEFGIDYAKLPEIVEGFNCLYEESVLMKKYPKFNIRKLNKKAKNLYKYLIDLFKNLRYDNNGIDNIHFISVLEKSNGLNKKEKDWVVSFYDSLYNFSFNPRLEISPRNVSYDERGNLILLDIAYCEITRNGVYANKVKTRMFLGV